jgi:hypothetical protein
MDDAGRLDDSDVLLWLVRDGVRDQMNWTSQQVSRTQQ